MCNVEQAIAKPGKAIRANDQSIADLEAEVDRLRKLEGTDDHPEHRCDRCGGRNINAWHADSDVWNRVAGEFSILCPICFSELASDASMEFEFAIWRLSLDGDDPEVSKLRVRLHDRLDECSGLHTEVERLRKHETWLKAGHETADGFLDTPSQSHIVDKICIIGHERDELYAEVDRLQAVVRELRNEYEPIDRPTDLQDYPEKFAAWRRKYDAETDRLCVAVQPTETE